jgi:hypothetical protein
VLPVAIVEVGRRPRPLDLLALLEDGGGGLGRRRFDLRAVGLHADGLAVV